MEANQAKTSGAPGMKVSARRARKDHKAQLGRLALAARVLRALAAAKY